MLNNVEFNNIYSLLKEGIKNSPVEFTDDMKKKCGELVDNKIQTELEKIKLDNQKLWSNAVDLIQKFNKPGEVQEIINKVAPTILSVKESSKRLMEVEYYNGKNSKPQVPDLDNRLKSLESEQDELLNSEINNKKNEDNKKINNEINNENELKEIENDTELVNIESNPDSSNRKNEKNTLKELQENKNENIPNNSNESGKKETNEAESEFEEEEEDEDEEAKGE